MVVWWFVDLGYGWFGLYKCMVNVHLPYMNAAHGVCTSPMGSQFLPSESRGVSDRKEQHDLELPELPSVDVRSPRFVDRWVECWSKFFSMWPVNLSYEKQEQQQQQQQQRQQPQRQRQRQQRQQRHKIPQNRAILVGFTCSGRMFIIKQEWR